MHKLWRRGTIVAQMLKVLIIYLPQLPWWHINTQQPTRDLDSFQNFPIVASKFPPFAEKFLFVLSRERTISIPRLIKRPLYGGHWMEWRKLAAASHNSMRAPRSQNWPKNKTEIPKLTKKRDRDPKIDQNTRLRSQNWPKNKTEIPKLTKKQDQDPKIDHKKKQDQDPKID